MEGTKYARMIALLQCDQVARQQLLKDPEGVLKNLGVEESILDEPHDKNAFARAREVLSTAGLSAGDNAVTGLKKIGNAAQKKFSKGYELKVDPFGFTLLERPVLPQKMDWTATATVKCTWGPWDGCNADADW